MLTYGEITNRNEAEKFVNGMLALELPREAILRGIRDSASEEWKRASTSVLQDASARALGASLVLLTLNRLEGIQI